MTGPDFMDEIDCGSFFDQIDDLIDFPTDNDCGLGVGSVNCNDFPTIWSDPPNGLLDSDPIFSGNHTNTGVSDLSAQLSVPYEDIVQLEWLSNFVEDSFAIGDDMTLIKENYPIKKESPQNPFHSTSPVSVLESSTTTTTTTSSSSSSCSIGKVISLNGPQRARSKRPRPTTFGPRPSIRIISPTSSFTGPTSSQVPLESDSFADSHLPKIPVDHDIDHKKIIKKKKTMIKNSTSSTVVVLNQPSFNQSIRKCMHCEITKTPQWRAGPMGPKTLCNACGVRYKSGRLFPEYRPAASPTFVPAFHSNSHKKVVEMRTKVPGIPKEPQPELVPNFHPGLDFV
ncbi:GATA transcription factor 8-like [Impatiens glandulifera]|uniref:GATA transcription factor 8-like n=1 Tax=Impatiens glandulifera TaxID=253017 RepID=UPI001FB0B8C0|nr:GATA transcription factor 8-like [Impatiens glandulifera]